jgi:hypothetical protein
VTTAWSVTADWYAVIGIELLAPPPGAPVPGAQPGGSVWRRHFRVPQVVTPSSVVTTAQPPPPPVPTAPAQAGGLIWRRQWRIPQARWDRFTQLPYITGLAGGGRGYFTDQFGNPRLVWGDAVWALCGNVGRWNGGNWKADYDTFIANRAAQGFTVLYGKPMGTLQSGNIDNNGGTFDGLFPFQGGAGANPSTGLTEAYWQRIDYFLAAAQAKGITVFMNAVGYASDFVAGGSGPLANKSVAEFTAYGTALGTRYKSQPNLVWMVADDYFGGSDDAQLSGFLSGLRGAGDTHVISIEMRPRRHWRGAPQTGSSTSPTPTTRSTTGLSRRTRKAARSRSSRETGTSTRATAPTRAAPGRSHTTRRSVRQPGGRSRQAHGARSTGLSRSGRTSQPRSRPQLPTGSTRTTRWSSARSLRAWPGGRTSSRT